jgi:hypothetical protein
MSWEIIKVALLLANVVLLVRMIFLDAKRMTRMEIVLGDHLDRHPRFSLSPDGKSLHVENIGGSASIDGKTIEAHRLH